MYLEKCHKAEQSYQIRTRGEQIYFAPATWADHLSNFFLFLIYFEKNGTVYLENKTKYFSIGTI